jgi:hypothetical protein
MLISNPVKKLKNCLPKKDITQPILSIMSKKEEKNCKLASRILNLLSRFFNCFIVRSCVFYSLTEVKKQIWLLLVLFPNFEAKRCQNGSNIGKLFVINLSYIRICSGRCNIFDISK